MTKFLTAADRAKAERCVPWGDDFDPAGAAEAFGWDTCQGDTEVPPGDGYPTSENPADEVPDEDDFGIRGVAVDAISNILYGSSPESRKAGLADLMDFMAGQVGSNADLDETIAKLRRATDGDEIQYRALGLAEWFRFQVNGPAHGEP